MLALLRRSFSSRLAPRGWGIDRQGRGLVQDVCNNVGGKCRALLSSAVWSRTVAFAGMRMVVGSADENHASKLIDSLACWHDDSCAAISEDPGASYRCVIDYTDNLPGWRNGIAEGPARELADKRFGKVRIFDGPRGKAVVLEGRGVIFCGADGMILCLADGGENSQRFLHAASEILTAHCLLATGYLLVHAGGVARGGKCSLWTGTSGVGKTTRVLELVSKGWDYCGDDVVVLSKGSNGTWNVLPYAPTANATMDTCERFSELSSLTRTKPVDRKYIFEVRRFFSTTVPETTSLERIYCLSTGGATQRQRLYMPEAFERIAPCFLNYLWPEDAGRVLGDVLNIASQIPVYSVSRDTTDWE